MTLGETIEQLTEVMQEQARAADRLEALAESETGLVRYELQATVRRLKGELATNRAHLEHLHFRLSFHIPERFNGRDPS